MVFIAWTSSIPKQTDNADPGDAYCSEDEIIKNFKKDLAKSESDISTISTKAVFGETKIDSSNIYSSWDESSATETTVLSSGIDIQPKKIKT